ncbi:MAG: DNA polymerase I [Bacteroidia bacterium]|nr:MAG: DNA polymerase I [Bacteroidia bacterium]
MKLFLIDALALIYRSHFAFIKNPRMTSYGKNTSATFGFVNTLLELILKEKPTHLGVAFDPPGPTKRHEEFANYKAQRQETPEDIIQAIPDIKRILKAWHIPILEIDGYEADDIIGTLAKKASTQNINVFMVTPDKDYAQLVDDHIFMYKPSIGKNPLEILDKNKVKEKFGVYPEQITDLLGLMGDSSDNYPGIPKIGEKTALELLNQYQTLENVLANAHNIQKKSIQETLSHNGHLGIASKKLATIYTDIDIPLDMNSLKLDPPNEQELLQIFTELEFKTLAQRILGKSIHYNSHPTAPNLFDASSPNHNLTNSSYNTPKTIKDVPHQYFTITQEKEIQNLVNELCQQQSVCFDSETNQLDAIGSQLVGLSFCYKPHEAFYIPIPDEYEKAKKILTLFQPFFENNNILKIGQNLKYDLLALKNYNIQVAEPFFDTMIAHYVIDAESKHNMDFLSEKYLNYTPISIETLIGKKGKNQKSMKEVELSKITEYAAEDADITFQLYEKFLPLIHQNQLENIFYTIESPLMPVLVEMEYQGVKIDVHILKELSQELHKELKTLEKQIYELSGTEFNIQSPKQLSEILFDKLNLTKGKKTATGQLSTNEETLLELAEEHEIVKKILDYRQTAKLKSTYVDALPELINPKTQRLHTTFAQTVAVTGRLSSINPNLQNIPIRTEKGKEIRKAFIASENHVLLSCDYSQIELRIMAALSQDENLIDAFAKKEDIHIATAARIFNVPLNEVNSDMRRKAKTANFGIIYGISAYGLAQRLNISRTEAKKLIDIYFEKYPKVKTYMENAIKSAREKGYVETMMGRKRYLKDIHSANFTVRSFAERTAINTPIQGTAADIIKLAMIDIHHLIQKNQWKTRMILQVHDELLFEVPNEEIDIVQEPIKKAMENAFSISVPLEVNIGIGTNWLEAH